MAAKTLILTIGALCAGLLFTTSAMAGGNSEKGEKLFKTKCKACHEIEKPVNKVGPNLVCVVGRKAATIEKYAYSTAMAQSGLTWNDATLTTYLKKPSAVVPKTKMTFAGLPKDDQIADLIAYLAHENDASKCTK